MHGDQNVIAVYVAYAAVAIALTAWLARTLFRNGAIFLRDVFEDRPALADALGVPVDRMPVMPEDVLELLHMEGGDR